jgi:hypothetical protein
MACTISASERKGVRKKCGCPNITDFSCTAWLETLSTSYKKKKGTKAKQKKKIKKQSEE